MVEPISLTELALMMSDAWVAATTSTTESGNKTSTTRLLNTSAKSLAEVGEQLGACVILATNQNESHITPFGTLAEAMKVARIENLSVDLCKKIIDVLEKARIRDQGSGQMATKEARAQAVCGLAHAIALMPLALA